MNLRKDHYRFRRSRFPCGCGLVVYPQPAAGVSPVASDSLLNSLTTPRGRGLPGGSVDLRGGQGGAVSRCVTVSLCVSLSLWRGAPGSGVVARGSVPHACLFVWASCTHLTVPWPATRNHTKPSVADLPTPVAGTAARCPGTQLASLLRSGARGVQCLLPSLWPPCLWGCSATERPGVCFSFQKPLSQTELWPLLLRNPLLGRWLETNEKQKKIVTALSGGSFGS